MMVLFTSVHHQHQRIHGVPKHHLHHQLQLRLAIERRHGHHSQLRRVDRQRDLVRLVGRAVDLAVAGLGSDAMAGGDAEVGSSWQLEEL